MADDEQSSRRTGETAAVLGALVLSTGTLVCCALPLLLVGLGLGASVAALVGTAPWLVTLSQYKGWMFAASGAALAAAAWLLYRSGRACPANPRLAALCALLDRWNRRLLILATSLWVIGFAVAYLWLPVRWWFDA